MGVFFEFTDYKRFIEKTHEYKNVPSPIFPSLKLLGLMTCFIITIILAGMYVPLERCWSPDYLAYPFVIKVLYYMVAALGKRFFFYSPFTATTGAIVASGLGYNGLKKAEGEDEETHTWDKIIGVYWYECEVVQSPVEMFRFWNYQVHVWLKYYIAVRLTPPG